MAACAPGTLAASIAGDDIPFPCRGFSLSRYEDPEYRKLLEKLGGNRPALKNNYGKDFPMAGKRKC